jgi:hypothetical protein
MSHQKWIVMTGFAAVIACGCSQMSSTRDASPMAPSGVSDARSAATASAHQDCSVNVGSTTHPLPALHLLQAWLNVSIQNAASTLNCGEVRSLDAKLEVVAAKLDEDPPNFDAACGASTALVNELQSLVSRGQLAEPTFPPPVPGGPTTALAAAEDLNEHWCDAAHGDLVGPRS